MFQVKGFSPKMETTVRHFLITALAIGGGAILQWVMKMDFGASTLVIDSLLGAALRFLSTYIPSGSTL